MPVVISDSSTLIHLAAIGRITLLRELYPMVTIPRAVWREVVTEGKGRAGTTELESALREGWIEVVSPTNEPLVRLLSRDLDEGESEVIALAIERQAALVLLDESEARQVAERYKLPKTGIVGILMLAKHQNKILSLRPELDKLRMEGGFWIDECLYQQALRAVGEL
jgi:predicted nucleic acid-binding protein